LFEPVKGDFHLEKLNLFKPIFVHRNIFNQLGDNSQF
jgi:hypothetical protein